MVSGDDKLFGGDGNDALRGDGNGAGAVGGNDELHGENGNDSVVATAALVGRSPSAVTTSSGAATATTSRSSVTARS